MNFNNDKVVVNRKRRSWAVQELMKEKERMRHQVNDLVLPPSSSPPAGERERKIIIKRHVPLHMELTFRSRCWGHTYSLPHTHTPVVPSSSEGKRTKKKQQGEEKSFKCLKVYSLPALAYVQLPPGFLLILLLLFSSLL